MVEECKPLDLGHNPPCHSPILLRLNSEHGRHSLEDQVLKLETQKTCLEQSITDYKEDMTEGLLNLSTPLPSLICQDPHREDPNHCSVVESPHHNIPMTGLPRVSSEKNKKGHCSGHISGWKEDAKFWFSICRSTGRPNTGTLHDIMRRIRNLFHYEEERREKLSW